MKILRVIYWTFGAHILLGGIGFWHDRGSETAKYVTIITALILARPLLVSLIKEIVRDVSDAVRKSLRRGIHGDDLEQIRTGR